MQAKKIVQVNMTTIKYTDLPGEIPAWQSPDRFRPLPFDLVEIETSKKIVTGWWTGNTWMGLRLRKEDKIISWRKSRELDFI